MNFDGTSKLSFTILLNVVELLELLRCHSETATIQSSSSYVSCRIIRIFVTETYTVEDCSYYKTTQYTRNSVTLNIPLPSHFSLEYVLKQTSSSYSAPYLDIGENSNNRMLVGQYARAGTNGLIVYKSTSTNYPYSTDPTFNQENTIHFTYDGTDYTYWINDLTPMIISDKGVTLSKLIHIEGGWGGYLKNIKIKPL